MGDSWEDIATPLPNKEEKSTKGSGLNPNAPSFSFSPGATSFVPSKVAQPPAGFTMPTYPPPSGGKVLDSPPPAASQASAPQPTAEPKELSPTSAASRGQGDAQPQDSERSQQGSESPKIESLSLASQANGSADKATSAQAAKPEAEPPSAPDDDPDDDEDQEKEEELKVIHEELAKEDSREHMNVVFIGHVDAGKSTTGGQILYLTGNVDERTIQKYEKEAKEKNRESWYMAYIMDTNEEERAKGKTVEVGRAHFTTEKKRYTILDAPGHKNYVPNMIAGATQADVGVLVISARKGEFETGFERGGQTREHAQLAKTLGVTRLIVAINKMDDPSVLSADGSWSKGRYDDIVTGLTPCLKSYGYNPKKDLAFLPMSGLLGTNIKDRMDKKIAPWYNGPSLFEVLDATEPLFRDPLGPFRMSVIDKYKDMGTIAMGKSEAGLVRKGDRLFVMPNKQAVTVATIYRDDVEVNAALGGENLRLRLTGIEDDEIQAGFIICSRHVPVPCVTHFQAQLQLLELLEHRAILTAGAKAVLHIHSLVEECEITRLISQFDIKTRTDKKVKYAKSNAIIVVRIDVEKPICIEPFDRVPQLGRFTLRDEGKTIAIGKVIKLPKSLKEASKPA